MKKLFITASLLAISIQTHCMDSDSESNKKRQFVTQKTVDKLIENLKTLQEPYFDRKVNTFYPTSITGKIVIEAIRFERSLPQHKKTRKHYQGYHSPSEWTPETYPPLRLTFDKKCFYSKNNILYQDQHKGILAPQKNKDGTYEVYMYSASWNTPLELRNSHKEFLAHHPNMFKMLGKQRSLNLHYAHKYDLAKTHCFFKFSADVIVQAKKYLSS